MQQKREDFQKGWAKIVAKAWSDPNFKKNFLKDPVNTLKAQGIEIPQGKRVIVNENTKDTLYLVIPEKPAGELSEEKLKEIAAGLSVSQCTSACG